MDTLEILLNSERKNMPEKDVKIKRLSKECGKDVLFRLRALDYNRVTEIKSNISDNDMNIHIILAGVVSPNLKSNELLEKYNAATPAELFKCDKPLLLPGEIEDISREIEKLSGYRIANIEEIKKK